MSLRAQIRILWDGGVEAKTDAACALASAAVKPQQAASIAKAGGIPPVVALLRSGTVLQKEKAAYLVAQFAQHVVGAGAKAVDAGVLKPLVAMIRDGTASEKEAASFAVTWLTADDRNDKHKEQVVECMGISPLVALVREGTKLSKCYAAIALSNLAINAEINAKVADGGAAPPLVAMLRDGDASEKSNAAIALRTLTQTVDTQRTVTENGAIPFLVAVLHEGRQGKEDGVRELSGQEAIKVEEASSQKMIKVKVDAATALCNILAHGQEANKIEEAGAIPPLLAMVRHGTAVEKAIAVDVLWRLCVIAGHAGHLEKIVASCRKSGVIPPLVALLRQIEADKKDKFNAMRLLWFLTSGDEDEANRTESLHAGAIPLLVTVMLDDTGDASEVAELVLNKFRGLGHWVAWN